MPTLSPYAQETSPAASVHMHGFGCQERTSRPWINRFSPDRSSDIGCRSRICALGRGQEPRWGLGFSRKSTSGGGVPMRFPGLLRFPAALLAIVGVAHAATMCPDGKWHADGSCKMCPDGSWTTAPQCSLSPEGQWVPDYGGGQRMAPDGSWIPNTGSTTMCPDGRWVPGTHCVLLPDGRWMGAQ